MGGNDQKRHVSKASAASSSAQSAKRLSNSQQVVGVAASAAARGSNATKDSSMHASGKDGHHQARHHHQPATPSPLTTISNADERGSSSLRQSNGSGPNAARAANAQRTSGPSGEPRLSGSGKKGQSQAQVHISLPNPVTIPLHILDVLEKLTLNETNLQRAVQRLQIQADDTERHLPVFDEETNAKQQRPDPDQAPNRDPTAPKFYLHNGRPKAPRACSAGRGTGILETVKSSASSSYDESRSEARKTPSQSTTKHLYGLHARSNPNSISQGKAINVLVKDSKGNILRDIQHNNHQLSKAPSFHRMLSGPNSSAIARKPLGKVVQKPMAVTNSRVVQNNDASDAREYSTSNSHSKLTEELEGDKTGHRILSVGRIVSTTKTKVEAGKVMGAGGDNLVNAIPNKLENKRMQNIAVSSNCSLSILLPEAQLHNTLKGSLHAGTVPLCAFLKQADNAINQHFQAQLESEIVDGTAEAEFTRTHRDDAGRVHFMHVPHAVSDLNICRASKHREAKRRLEAKAADTENTISIDKNLLQKIHPHGQASLRAFEQEMSCRRKLARRLCKMGKRAPEQLLCNTNQRHQVMETLRYKRIASEFERPRCRTQAERDLFKYYEQHGALQAGDYHTQLKSLPPYPHEIEWRGTPAFVSKEMGYGQLKDYYNDLGIGLKVKMHHFTPSNPSMQFIEETLQSRPIIAALEILGRPVTSTAAWPGKLDKNTLEGMPSGLTELQQRNAFVVKRTESLQINLSDEVQCFDDDAARRLYGDSISVSAQPFKDQLRNNAKDTGYGSTSDNNSSNILMDNFVQRACHITKSSSQCSDRPQRRLSAELYHDPTERVFEQPPLPVVRSVLSTGRQRGIRIDLDPFGKLTVLHEPSVRADELRVGMAARVSQLKQQTFDIRNSGSVCIQLTWETLDKPLKRHRRKDVSAGVSNNSEQTNRYFYFDERNIIIEPGEVKTVSVQFQPESAGVYIKRYRLVSDCTFEEKRSYSDQSAQIPAITVVRQEETPASQQGRKSSAKKRRHPVMYVTFEGYSYGKDLLRIPGQRVKSWVNEKVLRYRRRKVRRRQSWERIRPLPARFVVDQANRIDVRFALAHHGRFFYQRDIVRQLNRIWMYLQHKPLEPSQTSTPATTPKNLSATGTTATDGDDKSAKASSNAAQPVFPLSKPLWTAYRAREKRLQNEKLAEDGKIQPDKLKQANDIAAALLAKQHQSAAEIKANTISKFSEKAVVKSAKVVNAKLALPAPLTSITEQDDDEEDIEDEEAKAAGKDTADTTAAVAHTHEDDQAATAEHQAEIDQNSHNDQADDVELHSDAHHNQDHATICSDWTLPQMYEAIRSAPHITLNEKKVLFSYVGFLSQRLATAFEAAVPASTPLPTPLALINQLLFNVVDAIFDVHKLVVPRPFERAKVEEDEEEIVTSKVKLSKKRRTAAGGAAGGARTVGGAKKKAIEDKPSVTNATASKRTVDAQAITGGAAKNTLTAKSTGGLKSAASKKDMGETNTGKKGAASSGNSKSDKSPPTSATLDSKKSHAAGMAAAAGISGLSSAAAAAVSGQQAFELRGSGEDGRMNWKTMNKPARKRFLQVLGGYVQKAFHREMVAGFNFLAGNAAVPTEKPAERSLSRHRKKTPPYNGDQQPASAQVLTRTAAVPGKIPQFILNLLNNTSENLATSSRRAEQLIGLKNMTIDDEFKSLRPRLEPLFNAPIEDLAQKHRINPQYGVPDDLLVQIVKIDSLKYVRDDFATLLADQQQRNKAPVHKISGS